ncbi:MAG TPA: response regulator transcription factor [Candidatus Paceibacterota bacterium]|jgi:DNA-binding response OmpR family regulator|nr:response regulator transcription factor [Candidatus Paceibacterota bacterium]
MRILVVEDNKKLAGSLLRGLTQEGYAADALHDGVTAARRLAMSHADYDLVVLDVNLPEKDGIALCAELRAAGIMTPIIMLTAQDTIADRITGLDSGADDYLTKPFAFDELLSRVRALARRPREALPPALAVGNLVLRPVAQEVSIEGTKVDLTLKEFRILEYFMQHEGEVLTRQKIIDHLWDFSFNPLSRVMDVHINNLRNKLEKHDPSITIETIRGIGYRLSA